MSYWNEKVVVITGGAAGLGKRLAMHLVRSQARVVLADCNEAVLRDTVTELERLDDRIQGVTTDITCQESVEALFARVDETCGRLDALVNCAGRSGRGAALDTTPEVFQQFLDLNFLGTVRCSRAAIPRLLERRGHLVNIGSLAAKMAARFIGAYPVSKFAVAAYSHQLRLELNEQGLHVLLVCPGPIAREDAGQRYSQESADLPASAHKPGGGVKLKGLDPDLLCQRILRACERRQPELVIPSKVRWLAAITQLWPSLGDKIILKKTS
jgi:NAD(P)-dependent dehydrogenase (short-subunit alcohol dehydrogenase family)